MIAPSIPRLSIQRGALEYIRNRKTNKKFGQNRKLHLLSKLENPKTTLDNKTENPLSFSKKTENRMLKNEKSAMNTKTEKPKSFITKTEKPI